MTYTPEGLIRLVDELEESYLEQMATKTVLISFSGLDLTIPPWPELQLQIAEAKRTLRDRGADYLEHLAALRKGFLEDASLEAALERAQTLGPKDGFLH